MLESMLQRGQSSLQAPHGNLALCQQNEVNSTVRNDSTLICSPPASLSDYEHDHGSRFPLPPEHETLQYASKYFQNFNQAMPLFHLESFTETIKNWYRNPSQRNEATWASINVMIALSIHHTPDEKTAESDRVATRCIGNAQSVMDNLVYREEDLKGLQVILGLVIIFLGSPHPYPTSVLIATAVQLVHRLRLHLRTEHDETSSNTLAERRCLFWITYILDRDISSHTLEPYLLQEHDIDFDFDDTLASIPSFGALEFGAGIDFNYLLARIKLAQLQGKSYDLVHSVRASRFNPNQKQAATERLNQMLSEWYGSLPEQTNLRNFLQLDKRIQRHCISLHISYYQCLFIAHQTHARNGSWHQRLINFSDSIAHKEADIATNLETTQPILPLNWTRLLDASREFLSLSEVIGANDSALIW
jgi:hypothetical protein